MAYNRSRRSYAPRPARWMELRRAGTCHVCNKDLPAGSRGFWDPETRAITCTGLECATVDGLTTTKWVGSPVSGREVTVLDDHRVGPSLAPLVEFDQHRVIVTRFAGGGTSYRNSRGRCEDAPCCGCCSPY